ncbi:ester cyclase [Lichenibacterium minor]|uniref:Ester cyclase n=1 Tax=Lichenibacterium minor TaxID=2316528 RepID=A0A4V1RU27_9HYPH|nr:ester cyclase [Lichenibacterium minor]RYC29694.1 ester cyclase [Lichenibacterium minor]
MSLNHEKAVVRRFNEQVIVGGDRMAFEALIAPGFVNRSAPPSFPDGPEGMWNTFENVLRPALTELSVTIHDQVGEGDKVTTRKTISGRHTGSLLGVEATNRLVAIEVIDIVRVEDGRYAEHWGINNLPSVIAGLKQG